MSARKGTTAGNHVFATLVSMDPALVPGPLTTIAVPASILSGSRVIATASGIYALNPNTNDLVPLKALTGLADGLSAGDFQNALSTSGPGFLFDRIGGTFFNLATELPDNSDAQAELVSGLAGAVTRGQVFNGDTFDRERAAALFVAATVTTNGNTTVFDPGAGNHWRLLGYTLEMTGDAARAAAGLTVVTLGTNIVHAAYLPIDTDAAITGAIYSTGYVRLGKIGLAGAADANLVCNLSAAITRGSCRLNLHLVEETP